jgi:hypothetical protein
MDVDPPLPRSTSCCEIVKPIDPIEGTQDSLFITCEGFEDRSKGVIQHLSSGYRTQHSVIFRSKEYALKGKTPLNFNIINEILQQQTRNKPYVIEFDTDKPISSMEKFESIYSRWDQTLLLSHITIDISSFPRQELLVLLRVLDNIQHRPSLRLLYTEPIVYATELQGGWLTRGVRSVSSVPGFGGTQRPSKKKLLLMFLGHEDERAAITWKRHQPNLTILIAPDPSYREGLSGIIEKTHPLLYMRYKSTQSLLSVPARGINEVETLILDLWSKYNDTHFLVTAPLGTKLQTIGIYKAVRAQPDIQITYAIPAVYNFEGYSSGIGPIWEVFLNSK